MSLWSLELQRAGTWRHVGRVVRVIRSAWVHYRRHQQRQRDFAQLSAMSDFELRDIGISRDEIRAAILEGTYLRSMSR